MSAQAADKQPMAAPVPKTGAAPAVEEEEEKDWRATAYRTVKMLALFAAVQVGQWIWVEGVRLTCLVTKYATSYVRSMQVDVRCSHLSLV